MALSWKPLRTSRSADARLPSLLLSAAFNSDSYEVHVTDLTRIWGESLDRPSIIRRSQDEATSIDASDASQFHILLDKIKLGLEAGRGTRSSLTVNAGTGRPEITIKIIVDLPGGLLPLEWPVRLAAEEESSVTSQLIVPLLEAQDEHVQERSSLVEVIKDKDHVIQKLLDKIEEQGTPLGQIFPQAAGRGGRKVARTEAAGKVKGLGRFDVKVWKNNLDIGRSRDMKDLLEKVFGDAEPKSFGSLVRIQTSLGVTTWWESLRGKTINLSPESSETITASASPKTNHLILKAEDSSKDDDDFQVQASQPLPDAPKAMESKRIDDDSTDGHDLGAVSQHSRIPDSFPTSPPAVTSPKPKKLGVMGRRKPIVTAPSPKEDYTTDDVSSPAKQPSPEELPPPATVPKKKGALGRIGGKKQPPPPPKAPSPPPPSLPAETAKPKTGRLGKIGGKKMGSDDVLLVAKSSERAMTPFEDVNPSKERSAPPLKEQSNESRGRPTKVEIEATPPPRETSEERADRKRQQLKRELEVKSKAPVKKKRKF